MMLVQAGVGAAWDSRQLLDSRVYGDYSHPVAQQWGGSAGSRNRGPRPLGAPDRGHNLF